MNTKLQNVVAELDNFPAMITQVTADHIAVAAKRQRALRSVMGLVTVNAQVSEMALEVLDAVRTCETDEVQMNQFFSVVAAAEKRLIKAFPKMFGCGYEYDMAHEFYQILASTKFALYDIAEKNFAPKADAHVQEYADLMEEMRIGIEHDREAVELYGSY